MADNKFEQPELAALYDAFCEGRPDFPFYLPLVMSSESVLDVGCGTDALLHDTREAGHTERLCGLDPARGMLEQGRKRADIVWVQGDLGTTHWEGEFDLVVMTGHAFQVLLTDEALRTALSEIRSALIANGRFIFETRNPSIRGWEAWKPENAVEIVDEEGHHVKQTHEVLAIERDLLTFSVTYSSPSWDESLDSVGARFGFSMSKILPGS